MNDELNGFLSEQSQEEPQVEEQKEQAAPQEEAEPEVHGEPTAPSTEKRVPLAALESVRGEKNDWKSKALLLEGELNAMRAQRERPQQAPEEQQPVDPIAYVQQSMEDINQRVSERFARQVHGTEKVDKAFQLVLKEAQKNPAYGQQIYASPDPWDVIVKEGQRLEMMADMGNDPAAFEAKLREKIREELAAEAEASGAQPAARKIPTSLAGARSSAGRTAGVFTGPPSLDDILKQ